VTGSALRPKPAKPKQADRKCFVSTAIPAAAHKTLVRAAPTPWQRFTAPD